MRRDEMTLNDQVRAYWEAEPCGSAHWITGDTEPLSREWFDRIEDYRYQVEPFIHSVAQFTRYHGKSVLEIGVGAGTDHLQWARAFARCHGVDLTDAAIEVTRARLAMYGFESDLRRADAESLPYPDGHFDVVYSWGVIHHTENPDRVIAEIYRVLRPGGCFIGMMYGRRSAVVFVLWLRHGLLKGRPWRSFRDVVWHHMESIGTKAYTSKELGGLFQRFSSFRARPIITPYDHWKWPKSVSQFFPNSWGWFIAIQADK
jgi:ubiquinone/menaquinone biosynthesis C-methylase UbiE